MNTRDMGARTSLAEQQRIQEVPVDRTIKNRGGSNSGIAITPQLRRASGSAVTILLAFLIGFPLLWMTASSFKTTRSIISDAYPLSWKALLPSSPTWSNFTYLFENLGYGKNLTNTMIASIGQVGGGLIVATLAGYGFARLRSRFSSAVFAISMLGAFIPVEAIIVPLYKEMQGFGLLSTYWVLFLPFICNPFGIFLMRQAFREIPEDLFDSASVDGAGHWRTFVTIALPNVKPSMATLCLIQFIWSWSNFFWPLVANQDPNKVVAQVAMASLQTSANYQPMYGQMFAAASIITVPIVVLSIVLQRFYIQGLLSSGIK